MVSKKKATIICLSIISLEYLLKFFFFLKWYMQDLYDALNNDALNNDALNNDALNNDALNNPTKFQLYWIRT